jgi:peptidoglycan/xylan/chitin deacetylase (PgdA/CDA1 family)
VKAILTYHSIDDSGSVISVSRARFAEHVRWLAAGHVRVLSVPDLIAAPGAQPAVALTFDDAFANFATDAWPLLREQGMPATMFVPTCYVGASNAWDAIPGGAMPELQLMDWPTLARLRAEGLTLGAHTRSHPDLRRVSATQLHDEIAGSFADLARETGQAAEGFAYPYGYHDARVIDAVRRSCAWACTTQLAPLRGGESAHRLPRLDAYFLRGPAGLTRFGTIPFKLYLSGRAAIRRLRGR